MESLDSENLRAWRLLPTLCTRFSVDSHVVQAVLMRVTAEDDVEEFTDLMSRLSIIYDVQCPPHKGEA